MGSPLPQQTLAKSSGPGVWYNSLKMLHRLRRVTCFIIWRRLCSISNDPTGIPYVVLTPESSMSLRGTVCPGLIERESIWSDSGFCMPRLTYPNRSPSTNRPRQNQASLVPPWRVPLAGFIMRVLVQILLSNTMVSGTCVRSANLFGEKLSQAMVLMCV